MHAGRSDPDLIVTFAGPAALFARKYHNGLFPDTPMILGAIDLRYLGNAPLAENETAVTANHDFPGSSMTSCGYGHRPERY